MARLGVRGTFSQPGPSRPAVAVRLARTLGSAKTAMHHSSNVSACRREPNSHERGRAAKCRGPVAAGKETTSARHWSVAASSVGRVRAPKNYLVRSLAVRTESTRCCAVLRHSPAPDTPLRNQCTRRRGFTANSPARLHKSFPLHRQQREAGGIMCRSFRGLYVLHASHRGPALPNPSLEARPNSELPGPRSGLAHFPPHGPSTSLSIPPQLER